MADPWDAARYNDRFAFVWELARGLVNLLRPRRGERVLDLGCGTGQLTARVAEPGAEVVGLDRSAEMVAQARRNYPGLRFEVGDARDFAFPEPFDAVLSNAALHWVKEPERVIACARRALRPGGRFVAEFGGAGNAAALIGAIRAGAGAAGCPPFVSPWYFPGADEYAALLEKGGLAVDSAALFDRPTPLEGEAGLRDWVAMFAGAYLGGLPGAKRAEFLARVEEAARPALYRGGAWVADYRRLRVVAHRPAPGGKTG